MNLNPKPLLRLVALFVGLWCAFPVLAQEVTELDNSCEDVLLLDDCAASGKCCEQAAPIRVLLLTIARCNVDPEPDTQFCETLPHVLPKSVLSYILSFEAAKNLQHPIDQRFFVAGHPDHHPIPSTQLSPSADDRGLGEWLLALPAPFYVELRLPNTLKKSRLLAGVYHLPETPG